MELYGRKVGGARRAFIWRKQCLFYCYLKKFFHRSFVDKIPKGKQGSEEINLDHDENSEFDPKNPKTWSDESLEFIGSILKATEFHFDGFVVLFCVANDEKDSSVDYDELAWELEKCLTYHYVSTRSQVRNQEQADEGQFRIRNSQRKIHESLVQAVLNGPICRTFILCWEVDKKICPPVTLFMTNTYNINVL